MIVEVNLMGSNHAALKHRCEIVYRPALSCVEAYLDLRLASHYCPAKDGDLDSRRVCLTAKLN